MKRSKRLPEIHIPDVVGQLPLFDRRQKLAFAGSKGRRYRACVRAAQLSQSVPELEGRGFMRLR